MKIVMLSMALLLAGVGALELQELRLTNNTEQETLVSCTRSRDRRSENSDKDRPQT
jgi:hypothetical protein